jgi:hypothetical protein
MKRIEQEILKKTLARFKELTGQATVIKIGVRIPKDGELDAIIEIPKLGAALNAKIKLNVTNQTLGAIVHQLKLINAEGRNILIARYITPQLADRLKELDMQFLDTAGNAYINIPNMFLFIKGNKAKEEFVKEKPIRAFKPAGLQLIYALLCNPDQEDKPYRVMANIANIANGAVAWAIKDLKKLGYLVDMGKKGRRLIKKRELLQRWVNLYAELLRPKLLIGKYTTDNTDWWKNQDIINVNALYGGETAAALLTKYLKPQNHTIYAKDNYGKLLLQLKLKNDPNGNIEVLKKFWNFEDASADNNLVNPVLIYADLLATDDNRNIETANLIYKNEIIRYIGQD